MQLKSLVKTHIYVIKHFELKDFRAEYSSLKSSILLVRTKVMAEVTDINIRLNIQNVKMG